MDFSAIGVLDEWVSRDDILATLDISVATYKRYIREGILPRSTNRGGKWYTPRAEIVSHLERYQAQDRPEFQTVQSMDNPYLGRPLDQGVPEKSFLRMMTREGRAQEVAGQMEPDFTLYNLRHTFITRLLLPKQFGGAGLDIRTVQKRAGHSNIRTTEQYLHDIDVMSHATDELPY